MPTIFRLQKSDLQDLIRLLLPDIAEEKLSLFDEEKIKVLLSEWLMLNNCSSLHNFQKDSDGKWIKPNENECECCVRFKIGKKITIPTIDGELPKRESQMLYFRGPWIADKVKGKRGKKKYTIRSHLLECSSIDSMETNESTECSCTQIRTQLKNACIACFYLECLRAI